MNSAASDPVSPHALDAPQGGQPTPLAAALLQRPSQNPVNLALHLGVHVPGVFSNLSHEMDALVSSAGILDLGWRGKILVTGRDRLRWLNGMATNIVRELPQDEGNYDFILSPQGRIQGDCYIYRREEDLVLDTSLSQVPALLHHLRHYIIMDQVELKDVSEHWTALAVVGPKAAEVLAAAGVPAFSRVSGDNAHLAAAQIGGVEVVAVRAYHVTVPRYELWLQPSEVFAVWEALETAGAVPAGLQAAEALRVVEGIPLYGIDLGDRDLPQETSQMRAINFTKGCYLGQEIVERIRSRGKVHRQLQQFTLDGPMTSPPFDLTSDGQTIGRVTSAVSLDWGKLKGTFALGIVREEALENKAPIEYPGGAALPQASLPLPTL